LSDEVDSIYNEYRKVRSKLGPLVDPTGRLDMTLLSPRSSSPRSSSPPPRKTAASSSPSRRSPSPSSQPNSQQTVGPMEEKTACAVSSDVQSTAVAENHLPHGIIRKLDLQVVLPEGSGAQAEISETPGVESARSERLASQQQSPTCSAVALHHFPRAPLPARKAPAVGSGSVSARERAVKSLAPDLLGSPRSEAFSGPRPAPTSGPPSARQPKGGAPPSNQLPQLVPTRAATPATPDQSAANRLRVRRASGQDLAEKERSRTRRQAVQRDHHVHLQHHRDASAWQKNLRQRQRARFLELEQNDVQSQQGTRLSAYQFVRDAHEKGRYISKELELGVYSSVGMGIGSPPRTPEDEKAMRAWNGSVPETQQPLKKASHTQKDAAKSRDELRRWLGEPWERTSFAPIEDILEFHGVREEFQRAGAPGLGHITDEISGALSQEAEATDHGEEQKGRRPPMPVPPSEGGPSGTPRSHGSKLKIKSTSPLPRAPTRRSSKS